VLELARAVGAALSRVGEATNAIGRAASPEGAIAISGSEVATARYWHGVAPFVPGVGRLLDVVSRHHFELAREHFERTQSWDVMSRRMTRLAVGFIDMSGFTAATEDLDEVEFGRLMASFSVQVDETVRDLGGRVVKFVGDAAMVVAPQPTDLTAIAHQLVTSWATLGPDLSLHAGLAYGELLNQDGDFYGRAVNLAARLGALAGPGEILGSALIGEALPPEEWHVAWLEPRSIRGMAEPVVTCSIQRLPTS
jgi:adenylate cyclase